MPPPQPNIQEDEQGITLIVKVVPGSSKTAAAGVLETMIKIKVAAPPEKGKANQCLIAFLAKKLGVRKNAICIVTGQSNPIKHVQIAGISAAAFRNRLGLDT